MKLTTKFLNKVILFNKQFYNRYTIKNNLYRNNTFENYGNFLLQVNADYTKTLDLKSKKLIIIGFIDYYIFSKKIRTTQINDKHLEILNKTENKKIEEFIEGNYILIVIEKNNIEIFLDKFTKQDVYYFNKNGEIAISDSLELFEKFDLLGNINDVALLNYFLSYGNYPPKKHTLYNGIKRIGHREFLQIKDNKLTLNKLNKEIYNIEKYEQTKLDEYHNLLFESIYFRSSTEGINWIYLSSGWDSTAILAYLREMYDAKKIKGLLGVMKYSKRSGIINQFEINRAYKIAKYYGIELIEIPLDLTKQDSVDYFKSLLGFLFNKNIYSFNSYNFCKLSDFIHKNAKKNDSVFSGEISDGVHNLGFSQYATILNHPDLYFREYADKMSSYMYSPSFYKNLLENKYQEDVIYKFLKSRYNEKSFYLPKKHNIQDLKLLYLASFFISRVRIPFYNNFTSNLFLPRAKKIYKQIIQEYISEYTEQLNYDNLYSVIINLYNSFHWQGSTVKIISNSLERYGYTIKLPFWDRFLNQYLQKMPESWGRGLDFNHTKYPLKYSLKKKLNYPVHLQQGPHSYLYDVNPTFNHLKEIITASSLTELFKNNLSENNIRETINSDIINFEYLKNLIRKYRNGNEMSGNELTDISSTILLSLIHKR